MGSTQPPGADAGGETGAGNVNTNGVGDAPGEALADGNGEGDPAADGDDPDEVGAADGERTTAAVLVVLPHPTATSKTSTAASRMLVS